MDDTKMTDGETGGMTAAQAMQYETFRETVESGGTVITAGGHVLTPESSHEEITAAAVAGGAAVDDMGGSIWPGAGAY